MVALRAKEAQLRHSYPEKTEEELADLLLNEGADDKFITTAAGVRLRPQTPQRDIIPSLKFAPTPKAISRPKTPCAKLETLVTSKESKEDDTPVSVDAETQTEDQRPSSPPLLVAAAQSTVTTASKMKDSKETLLANDHKPVRTARLPDAIPRDTDDSSQLAIPTAEDFDMSTLGQGNSDPPKASLQNSLLPWTRQIWAVVLPWISTALFPALELLGSIMDVLLNSLSWIIDIPTKLLKSVQRVSWEQLLIKFLSALPTLFQILIVVFWFYDITRPYDLEPPSQTGPDGEYIDPEDFEPEPTLYQQASDSLFDFLAHHFNIYSETAHTFERHYIRPFGLEYEIGCLLERTGEQILRKLFDITFFLSFWNLFGKLWRRKVVYWVIITLAFVCVFWHIYCLGCYIRPPGEKIALADSLMRFSSLQNQKTAAVTTSATSTIFSAVPTASPVVKAMSVNKRKHPDFESASSQLLTLYLAVTGLSVFTVGSPVVSFFLWVVCWFPGVRCAR